MITEDYVSFKIAKLLKEKGFNEEIETEFISIDDIRIFKKNNYSDRNSTLLLNEYSAPTLQMAMKWLREEKNIFIVIEPHAYDYINEKNSSYVFSLWQGDNYCENPLLKDFPSYEEAVEAALKYSLENLV